MASLASRIEQVLADVRPSATFTSDSGYFDDSPAKMMELRQLLDSKFDKERLEAMKHIIALMNSGRDMSNFFPDVVKIITNDTPELKKLVFNYILNYASDNQELALLCINSIRKDLQDPNQRTRANALKTITGIRVPMVVHLVVMAMKSAVKDGSAFVRKVAAHALPKVLRIDSEQASAVHDMLRVLLADREPMVLASAMFAFAEVCLSNGQQQLSGANKQQKKSEKKAARSDDDDSSDDDEDEEEAALDIWAFLHPHFKKYCHLLADLDEWGQMQALHVLTMYGRANFASPFKDELVKAAAASSGKPEKERAFYSDDEDEEDGKGDDDASKKKPSAEMDPDHRLLLRCAGNLLYSQNSGVVLAASSLFQSLAPASECGRVAKALVHACRAHPEMQFGLLSSINTLIATKGAAIFRPFIKSFYVQANDPMYIRELKLDILASLVTEMHMTGILREFQAYFRDPNAAFVAAAIQALGRCAVNVPETAQQCVKGLLALVTRHDQRASKAPSSSSSSETNEDDSSSSASSSSSSPSSQNQVVAQAVIVLRQLLQHNPSLHESFLVAVVRLLDTARVPEARAAIVWTIGEYRDKIPKLYPDALRRLAKGFRDEALETKVQILNAAVKMYRSNPAQIGLMLKYILDLCKYDTNYDLRDRARLFRKLFLTETGEPRDVSSESSLSALEQKLLESLLAIKPSPKMVSPFKERERFIIGSLSHLLSHPAKGYQPLPDFPEVGSDPALREIKVEAPVVSNKPQAVYAHGKKVETKTTSTGKDAKKKSKEFDPDHFYSDVDSDASDRSDSDSDRSSTYGSSNHDSDSDRSRSRSRSRSPRSRSRTPSPSGSERSGRSWSRSRSRTPSRSRSRTPSRSRSPSPSRSRSTSPAVASRAAATAAAAASASDDDSTAAKDRSTLISNHRSPALKGQSDRSRSASPVAAAVSSSSPKLGAADASKGKGKKASGNKSASPVSDNLDDFVADADDQGDDDLEAMLGDDKTDDA